jgi:microcystin-dependent protein
MSEPFLCQISTFAFNFPPKGWALCNGQLLPINQNQALFSLLGTTYGGNGIENFALPNLQGNVPLMADGSFGLGGTGGEQNHTVIPTELPAHTHGVVAASAPGSQISAPGNFPAALETDAYSTHSPTTSLGNGMTAVGGSQPHNNMQPYLVLNFCIALEGIFPSRN